MLERHPHGVLVHVWVVAGSSRDRVVGPHGGFLKVRVAAAANRGAANRAVSRLVATALGGKSGSVVAGNSSRRKQIVVFGVDLDRAEATLRSRGVAAE